jgi:eukaryotic-like serine/threonine-protein kinase
VIGTRVNNYEIVSLIGEGGMGAVYLARHPLIDRRAAIKVLHPQLASDRGQVSRFFNEARAANAIRHPNIIDVIDVGLLPGSERPYLMMELLEGETLASRLVRLGSLTAEAAIEIARQTASALGAAHAKGIVHRDLKPDNLFLVPRSAPPGDLVKLLDFGIAKLRSELGGTIVRTQTGLLLGTPPYMSPEQCQGLSAGIDRRTDVYALGIILFEMVCGAPPFLAEGFGNVLIMHLTQEPPSPRSRNPAVPPALEAIILRALAKDPAERFGSMAALEAALATVPPASAGEALAPATRNRPGSPPTARLPAPAATRAVSSELEAVGELATDPASRRRRRSYRPLVLGSAVMMALAAAGYLGLTQRLSVGASPPAAAFNAEAPPGPARAIAPATPNGPQPASAEAPPAAPPPATSPAAGGPDAGAVESRPRRSARRTAAPAVVRPPRRGPEKW